MSIYIPPDLRKFVRQRGGNSCEYCRIPESMTFVPLEVDHIISLKRGGVSDETNLALSCSLCNKHKGSDIASIDHKTDTIVPLFHPRKDNWFDHFQKRAILTFRPSASVLQCR